VNVTTREQMRKFDGKTYWFHRVILDNHIQFPPGISQDANEARRIAYRNLIDVCLNNGGVKMKMLTDNRVKVVKGPTIDQENQHNTDDLDINGKKNLSIKISQIFFLQQPTFQWQIFRVYLIARWPIKISFFFIK
jgi:hypothetical protein